MPAWACRCCPNSQSTIEGKASWLTAAGRVPWRSILLASDVYSGRVTGYGLLDAGVELRFPGSRTTLTVDGQNLLDHRH